ncbi:MAG TPA: vWA domain-containing protein [Gaiellaceae bacterium]|nr:vWA domain-containing protein [Gaiellaceae bacterium]
MLVAALAAEAFVFSHGARRAAADYAPKNTIVVLDLSGSIEGPAYAQVGSLLDSLAANTGGGRRVGLVLFSDVAQEALPPGTKPAELRAYARYFRPLRTGRPSRSDLGIRTDAAYPDNPWMNSFSGGTNISSGLALARRLVARDRVGSTRVLLVSDLFDGVGDYRRLKSELLAYTRTPGVELRVLPIEPRSKETMSMFASYLGTHRVAVAAPPPRRVASAGPAAAFPVAFVVLLGVVAVALAGNEIVAPRLRWRVPQP